MSCNVCNKKFLDQRCSKVVYSHLKNKQINEKRQITKWLKMNLKTENILI